MVNSKTFPYTKPSTSKVAQVLPETVVLASKQGTWRGIEVVQRRHTVSDHDFPPLSFHTIGINLGQPLNAVERIDGRVYEGCLLGVALMFYLQTYSAIGIGESKVKPMLFT